MAKLIRELGLESKLDEMVWWEVSDGVRKYGKLLFWDNDVAIVEREDGALVAVAQSPFMEDAEIDDAPEQDN